jgi:4'-phosphopantetheinyl transferase
MPPDRAARAFAQVWTVQEACVKARGTGLSGAPWRVPAEPDRPVGAWGGLRWQRLPWPAAAGARHTALALAFGPPPGTHTRRDRGAGGPPPEPLREDPLPTTAPRRSAPSFPKEPDAH